MSENKYDSELIGWADDPIYNENGELISWTVRLKDTELKDILENYTTKRDENGQGGNARLKLFMSKNGKACASIYNFNSDAAKERRERAMVMAKENSSSNDDSDELPF